MDIRIQDIDYLDCWDTSIFVRKFWFWIRYCVVVFKGTGVYHSLICV